MKNKNKLLLLLLGLAPTFSQAQQGFQAEYFNGRNFDQKVLTRTDAQIHFVWNNVPPVPGLDPHVYSIRWKGFLTAPESARG
jgi:hypothetical protein